MWTTFAATVGGSAAGLTGLTFIVVAFRFDVVATSQEYRNRAAQTVSLFLTTTVTASLVTLPQPTWALGVELLIAAAASAGLLSVLDHAARRGTSQHARPVLVVALVVFAAGIAAAGLFAIAGLHQGAGLLRRECAAGPHVGRLRDVGLPHPGGHAADRRGGSCGQRNPLTRQNRDRTEPETRSSRHRQTPFRYSPGRARLARMTRTIASRDALLTAVRAGARVKSTCSSGATGAARRAARRELPEPVVALSVHRGRRRVRDGGALDDGREGPPVRRRRRGAAGPRGTSPRAGEEGRPAGAGLRRGAVWRRERFRIVVEGSVHKFGADEELREFLLGTGERVLVEASPLDRVWGIGLAADDEAAGDPERWRGDNELGFALMVARERLRGATGGGALREWVSTVCGWVRCGPAGVLRSSPRP